MAAWRRAQRRDQRRFRTRQKVEYKKGPFWKPGEIKQTLGRALPRPGDAKSTSNFMSQWMVADTIREPGEDFEGPDVFSQFSHLVGNDDIRESLAEAKKELEDFKLKQSQTAKVDGTGKADPFGMLPFDQPVTEVDRSQMNEVVSRAASGGVVTPDAAEAGLSRPIAVAVKAGTGDTFEKVQAFAVSGQYGMVSLVDDKPGGVVRTAAERLDLATGRSTGSAAFDAATMPDDISFDGQRVSGIATARSSNRSNRVDVWDWSGKEPAHLVSFKPSRAKSGPGQDTYVTATHFLADGNLAVVDSDGRVTVWRFSPAAGNAAEGGSGTEPTVTGVWSIALGSRPAVTRSPGGHQLAALAGDEVLLLDAATGDPIAVRSDLGFSPTQLAFSPSGRFLGLTSGNQFAVLDLVENTVSPRVALPPGPEDLLVTDNGNVVTRGRYLDRQTGATVWAYTPPEGMSDFFRIPGTKIGLTRSNNGTRTLAAWPLPHANAAAAPVPPVRNLLGKGSVVAIDLAAVEGDAAAKAQLQQGFAEQVEARGATVAPAGTAAPVRIVGETVTKTEEQQYRQIGVGGSGTQSATVTTKTTTISVVADDQRLWGVSSTSGSGGFSVQLKEGETLQQSLDRQAMVNLGGFSSRGLPQIIPAPADPPATTDLRPGGFGN